MFQMLSDTGFSSYRAHCFSLILELPDISMPSLRAIIYKVQKEGAAWK
ncbi:hypothetical protein V6Z11_A07G182100 [Gossypium hirsutum]